MSINKKLKLNADDTEKNTRYVYTDEFGDTHVFSEEYFYVEGNTKQQIADKSQINIEANGELTYNGKHVYKKQNCKGYTLIPELNDYKGYELIEQRIDERIELEEYLLKTEPELKGYVRVCGVHGELSENNVDFTASGNFTKENCEAFLDGVSAESDEIIIKETEWSKWSEGNKQILTDRARKNFERVKYAFSKYFKKKEELDSLLLNTPVSYLKDGAGKIYGFNSDGDLVLIADTYGNYLSVEYDLNNRISTIYGGNKAVAKFEYESGKLQSITDSRGRRVEYSYDTSNRLTKVTYPDGKTCTMTYTSDNRIATLTSKYGYVNTFAYNGTKLSRLTTKKSNTIISDIVVTFGTDNSVTLTTEKDEYETYKFNSDNKLIEYKTRDEQYREKKQTFTYSNGGKTVTTVTSSNLNNQMLTETKEYNDLGMLISETVSNHQVSENMYESINKYYFYDADNKLIRINTNKYQQIYYYPDDEDPDYNSIVQVEKYSYDNHGNLTLIESYINGEEQSSGINFEERVYNDDGDMVKRIRWNSLDSSSKFYEEYEREKDGRVKYEKDETGAYAAMYEYRDGTNEVNSVTYANGGKIAYGRNPYNGEVTSVTASTAEGEANTNDIVYENGLPVKVKSGNTTLENKYDHKGRKTEVKVNGVTQSTFTYNDAYNYDSDDGYYDFGEQSQTYKTGNGDVTVRHLKYGESGARGAVCIGETLRVNGGDVSSIGYNEKGLVTKKSYINAAHNAFLRTDYSYDSYDKVTRIATRYNNTDNYIFTEDYTYNVFGELKQKSLCLTGEVTQTYNYSYKNSAARSLDYISFSGYKFKPLTDVYGRNTGKEIYNGANKIAGEYITYRKVGDHATNMPATVWFGSGSEIKDSIKYKYDLCGNISEITQNGHLLARYTYDSLNRLIREDNKPLNKTVIFTYDTAGNITERCKYDFTLYEVNPHDENSGEHYSYDYEGDRLVSYNGVACEYNNLGNPTKYRGKTCEWQYGNRLTKYGNTTFAYDGLGRRISKGNITFTYDSDGRLIKQSNGLEFVYDANGLAGLKYQNALYFYRRDAQGNIIAILNSSGEVVSTYTYDAWGNYELGGSNTGLGNLNPFRYRGYYYDTETKLYYLQSRYYDPEVGRFISQDSIDYADPETINGLNLYAYCCNNPVMNVDPTGKSWSSFWRKARDWFSTVTGWMNPFNTITGGVAIISAMIEGRWDDLRSDWNNGCFNPFNQDPNVALNAKVFSFYKGESVIKQSIFPSSFQIAGTIFLRPDQANIQALNHEFGHGIQERFLGLNYISRVAIPSFITYFFVDENRQYFSMPWERTADWFGGVNRGNYKKGSLGWGFAENILGVGLIPWYLIFGY